MNGIFPHWKTNRSRGPAPVSPQKLRGHALVRIENPSRYLFSCPVGFADNSHFTISNKLNKQVRYFVRNRVNKQS